MEGAILQGWTESSRIAEPTYTGLTPFASRQAGGPTWARGGNSAFEASGIRNPDGGGRFFRGGGGC